MGITVAYRGRLADMGRVEDFEDRLLDLALEVGGLGQIWRTSADDQPQRVVRGVILNLAPGQESVSMLLSPEGWLIGLMDIEDAERGQLTAPPWCFTKTQYGPIEGHVALVEMLDALRREFLTDLEISDEGGYWPTRDLAELRRRHSVLQQAVEGMAAGLQRHGLSAEAAADPEILFKRIERIAAQVHRTLQRPSEHPPVSYPENEATGVPADPDTTEALWDEMFKHNRRQQERLQRALEERRLAGEDDEAAYENALGDLGLEPPGAETEDDDEPWREEQETFGEPFGDGSESIEPEVDLAGAENDDPIGHERHPLLERALDLLKDLHTLVRGVDNRYESWLRTLFQGAGDAMGGLAQALSPYDPDPDDYGLRIVQLKRALRGAAFARGALFPLRSSLPAEAYDDLHQRLADMEKDIFQEFARVRAEHRGEENEG